MEEEDYEALSLRNSNRRKLNFRKASSSVSIEFRHTDSVRSLHSSTNMKDGIERSLLLSSDSTLCEHDKDEIKRRIQLAATYLSDYEAGRYPVFDESIIVTSISFEKQFYYNYDISSWKVLIHQIRFHPLWEVLRFFAVATLFFASCYEQPWQADVNSNSLQEKQTHTYLMMVSLTLLVLEMFAMLYLKGVVSYSMTLGLVFCSAIVFCSYILWLLDRPTVFLLGALKPMVLYAMYPQFRDGVNALYSIIPIASKVIAMELILICMFAAIATCLYSDFESFAHFETSFLSMFKCACNIIYLSLFVVMLVTYFPFSQCLRR